MNCKESLKLMEDYAAGELAEETAEAVGLHIFSCAACEKEFEFFSREKEIYAQYLFEIEPPADLRERFQTRLDALQTAGTVKQTSRRGIGVWLSGIFGAMPLKPVFGFASLAAICAVGFFALRNSQDSANLQTAFVAANNAQKISNGAIKNADSFPSSEAKQTPQIAATDSRKYITKVSETKSKRAEVSPKNSFGKKNLKVEIKQPKAKKSPDDNAEKDWQIRELRALEIETAKNIEKIEMLLRSFRNARFNEEDSTFDVAYESKQARKLLSTINLLQQKAELFGDIYTAEILNRVEPYLLEIANLDQKPLLEDVLEIRKRVREQNLIASLQTF